MTREIKFRAWWTKHSVMVTPETFTKLLDKERLAVAYAPSETDPFGAEIDYLTGNPFSNPDLIVEQFTDLTDKNGREIYEGDIVAEDIQLSPGEMHYADGHVVRSEAIIDRITYVITWDDSNAGFDPFGWADGDELDSKECEVIGNVHENPDLVGR